MSELKRPTDLNNTPNVTENVASDAPNKLVKKVHRRGSFGQARGIVREWWWLRISAGLLVPLSVWFLFSLITQLLDQSTVSLRTWLQAPGVVIAMALFLGLSFIHGRLGLHEIIVDYVHCKAKKRALNLFVDLLSLGLAVASIAALWQLHSMA